MKYFLTHSKNPERSAVIWNMIASIAMAFQSVILLVVISHTPGLGLVPAGIYTMGNTLNNLFLCIGKYGVRTFQVSDVKKEYSFKTYKTARILSVLAMALVSIVYVLYAKTTKSYSLEKTLIIIWMCIYKLPDAYEDVYYGEYQRNDRLDVASKATALRMIINIVLWSVLLLVTRDMIKSVCITTTVTIIIMFWFINITREYTYYNPTKTEQESDNNGQPSKGVISLLWVTFPLAISAFLTIYIGTAPRLSIDKLMDDSSQAIYGYIVMPVFVVQLLLMFILNPVIYRMSCLWEEGSKEQYLKETLKQALMVLIISVVCIVGAWLLGIPILSFMYNTDLGQFKSSLIIMMVGSGLLAYATLLQVLLTIMRQQKLIIAGYLIVSIIAFLFSDKAVTMNGIKGAALFYLCLLVILDAIYFLGYCIRIKRTAVEN